MVEDLKARMKSLVKRDAVESELDDELRFHFDAAVAKLEARGHSREEAQRLARLEFGSSDSVKEEHRDARGTRALETLVTDLKYALRLLKKGARLRDHRDSHAGPGHRRQRRHFQFHRSVGDQAASVPAGRSPDGDAIA